MKSNLIKSNNKALQHLEFIGSTVARHVLEKIFEIDLWMLEKPRAIHYETIQRNLRRLGRKNATIKFPGGLAFGISVGMRKRGRWHLDDLRPCPKPPHPRIKRRHYTQRRP